MDKYCYTPDISWYRSPNLLDDFWSACQVYGHGIKKPKKTLIKDTNTCTGYDGKIFFSMITELRLCKTLVLVWPLLSYHPAAVRVGVGVRIWLAWAQWQIILLAHNSPLKATRCYNTSERFKKKKEKIRNRKTFRLLNAERLQHRLVGIMEQWGGRERCWDMPEWLSLPCNTEDWTQDEPLLAQIYLRCQVCPRDYPPCCAALRQLLWWESSSSTGQQKSGSVLLSDLFFGSLYKVWWTT